MNIDWSKAPEDATHKDPDTDCFYKLVKDVWHLICGDGESVVSASLYNGETKPSDLIERPKKQGAWDGSGKPPIGIECEVRCNDVWSICKTLAYHQVSDTAVAVHFLDGSNSLFWCATFRPIKTAEQVAEEEKVAAIAEIRDVVIAASGRTVATISECLAAVALYDAGYRKQ